MPGSAQPRGVVAQIGEVGDPGFAQPQFCCRGDHAGLLRRDLAIVREVHSAIYGWPEYIGTPALRTSLGKLISSGRDDSGRSLTGLYEDAAEFYEQYGLFLRRGHRPPVELRHNTITVVKLLLFYMHKLRDRMATGNEEGPAPVHLQLLYPERFPDEIDPDLYRDLTLYSAGTGRVYFPNAGYIYGGNFVGNENKGIDCSAYLSKATGSSVRMSTWYMSVAWLVDRGRSEEVDPAILDEFTGLGLEQTLEEFMAVDPVSDDLKPGDLVVWREDSGGGHVTMYTGLGRGNRIIGIEATRADDKSKEGLLFVSHELQADDAATYVLRRRQDAAHRVMPKPVIY